MVLESAKEWQSHDSQLASLTPETSHLHFTVREGHMEKLTFEQKQLLKKVRHADGWGNVIPGTGTGGTRALRQERAYVGEEGVWDD